MKFSSKLTTICAGVGIAMTSLIIAPEVKAYENSYGENCWYANGYRLCYRKKDVLGSMNRWTLKYIDNNTSLTFDVICDGKTLMAYDSTDRGGLQRESITQLLTSFCAS